MPVNSPCTISYTQSRTHFRDLAARCGWELEAHPIDALGPDGDELTIEVAVSPGGSRERTVIVSSGLHGVEAAFGAAVQGEVLETRAQFEADAAEVRFVLLHALNPFGFAWSRRVNERNVDLNRNFLLAGEEFQGSPAAYRKLDPLLNPQRPPRAIDGFYLQAGLAVLREGMPALKQAVAGGQYDYRKGLFFGGSGASATQKILREHLPRWVGGTSRVVHLDFHTGLGRWGTFKLLLDGSVSAEQRDWMTRCFGKEATEPASSDGVAYAARGSLGPWCAALLPNVEYLYACAEFGT